MNGAGGIFLVAVIEVQSQCLYGFAEAVCVGDPILGPVVQNVPLARSHNPRTLWKNGEHRIT